jgi:hypothetical protein
MALPDLNGFQHKFTGRATVMTDEDRIEQYAFTREYVQALDPRGLLEIQFARTLSIDTWRLNRLKAIEENLFAFGTFGPAANIETEHPQVHHAITQARVFAREAKAFRELSLYEQRLNRSIQNNLNLFLKLQDRRKAEERLNALASREPKPLTRAAGASSQAENVIAFPAVSEAPDAILSASSHKQGN